MLALFNIEQWLDKGGLALAASIIFAETGLLVGFFLPGDSLLFLSGFAFPAESFPPAVRFVSTLFPSTPGIRGFIALNQMGAHWSEVQPQLLHLSALAVAYLCIAWLIARWRLSTFAPDASPNAP